MEQLSRLSQNLKARLGEGGVSQLSKLPKGKTPMWQAAIMSISGGWLNALDYPILVVVDVVSTPEVWVSMESLKGSAWKVPWLSIHT